MGIRSGKFDDNVGKNHIRITDTLDIERMAALSVHKRRLVDGEVGAIDAAYDIKEASNVVDFSGSRFQFQISWKHNSFVDSGVQGFADFFDFGANWCATNAEAFLQVSLQTSSRKIIQSYTHL